MNGFLHRTELLLGGAVMERVLAARVIIVGLGGVGSWCAEGLARSGVGTLTLVDADVICPTNVNRQLQATPSTVGRGKAEVLTERLREINPSATIDARMVRYDEQSCGSFDLGAYDYVIDAIDSLGDKLLLIERALQSDTTLFSSMGAGNRMDPSRIRVDTIARSHGCPLARAVRSGLKKRGVPADPLCVYSDEPPRSRREHAERGGGCGSEELSHIPRERVNGTVVHLTAIFGFTLASLVLRDIEKKIGVRPH